MLYSFFANDASALQKKNTTHDNAVKLFLNLKDKIKNSEILYSSIENQSTFNIFVPFVPNGEYLGVMYIKISPDFSFVTNEISSGFDKVSVIYSSLIFLGLIAIYLASSRAVRERNKVQELLFERTC